MSTYFSNIQAHNIWTTNFPNEHEYRGFAVKARRCATEGNMVVSTVKDTCDSVSISKPPALIETPLQQPRRQLIDLQNLGAHRDAATAIVRSIRG